MPWISWWKETPLVIGVKENVPLVCHEVLLWHTFHQSDPTVRHTLTEPFPLSPSLPLLLTLLYPCPQDLFSIPGFISTLPLSVGDRGQV